MSAPWGSMFTMDEFLEELAFSDHKMEFYGGRIVDFAGGSIAHGDLCARLIVAFKLASRVGCRVLTSGVAVRIRTDAYLFPDLSYTCESIDAAASAILAPTVLVEVISPHSSRRDRVEKLAAYRSLPSLREYLIVDSRTPGVTLISRLSDGSLRQQDFGVASPPGSEIAPGASSAVVALETLDVRFALDELYEGLF